MPVMKQHEFKPMLKEAIVLDLSDIGRQAGRITQAAEERARQIVADAERQVAGLADNAASDGFARGHREGLEKGHAEGLERGRKEAFEQAAAQFRKIQQAWIDAAAQWDSYRVKLDQDARQGVLELALRLTEKMVHRVIEVDQNVVVDQLRAALGHVCGAAELTVHVSPDDREVLDAAMPELMREFRQFKHVQLVSDPEVDRGGCVVSHEHGRVDGTLATQLRRVVELLLPDAEEPQPAAPVLASEPEQAIAPPQAQESAAP